MLLLGRRPGRRGSEAGEPTALTRRQLLWTLAKAAFAYPFATIPLLGSTSRNSSAQSQAPVPARHLSDDELQEEIVNRAFLFFWNEAGARSGLVRDRALADGASDQRRISSIAATGFGLTALCIGH